MGLGKTLQTIVMLARAHERGEIGGPHGPRCRWVALTATTPRCGTKVSSSPSQVPVLVVAPTSVVTSWPSPWQTLRCSSTPTMLRLDDAASHGIRWSGVVLDEAQFVKNRQTETHVAARKLGAPFTIAVTGTPLEAR